ncbi:unnamed protein product [Pedinophyceae sp. YPF-701]|nr:unnamed protein product [Pedinophyceae sp. YPF-701]
MDAENERSEAVDVRASLPDASGGDGAESGPQTAEDGRFQLTSMLVAKGGDLGPGLCAVGTKLSLQASEARDGEEAGDGTPRRKPSVPRFPSRPRAKRQLSFPLAATIGATPREVSKPDVDGPMTARMRVMIRRATENGFGSCRAERQLDPEEERRKAQQRVIDRQRRERLEAQAAQAEVMQRRDAALQWRSSIQEKRERHRVEIYALNALLRMSEERRVQALLAAQEDEDDSSVDGYAIEHAV